MTDTDEELVADLLLRWDEPREQGQDVSSLELCQACPHLSDELERRICALRASDWLDNPIEVSDMSELYDTTPHEPHTLVGRYRLDVLIAECGFAQVWRAYDLELHRNVAVKLPKPSRLDSTDTFIDEARRVARLKHPGIVPVYDVGRDNGNVFIVSEFIEGGNLSGQIKRAPLSVQQATRWTAEIAEALEYAHVNGVVHRDIKPANILIDHHGRALLADFGIAQSATKTGRFAPSIGTLRYMAPEQLEGNEVDARSDVYSLGVVLYEMLTGKLPYSSDQPNTVRQEIAAGVKLGSEGIPSELRRICEKALQLDPQNRFQSATLFAAQLGHRTQRSRNKGIVLSLLVLTVALGVGIFALWRPHSSESPTKPAVVPLDAQWRTRVEKLTADEQVIEVAARDSDILRSVTTLEEINERSAADFWKTVQKPTNYKEAVDLGNLNFDQHQYVVASQYYTVAIGFDAAKAQAYFKRGECHFHVESYKESVNDFRKAVELESDNPIVFDRLANANFHLRQFDDAVAAMEMAIKLNPPEVDRFKKSLATMLSNRAFTYSQEKKYSDAIADLDKALELDPNSINFHRLRAGCYYNSKDYENALPDFDEAIRRDLRNSSYYLNRGYCLQALGRNDEAARDYKKAEELGLK